MASRTFMNPAMGAHLAQAPAPASTPQGDDQAGEGTQATGYATPDLGPFECENCIHFEAPGSCNHPQVIADPEVQGQVDPEGCCNLFKSAHNETQDQEHMEGEDEDALHEQGA